jgi:transcription-repair coupling factor (superfamily II helicase)
MRKVRRGNYDLPIKKSEKKPLFLFSTAEKSVEIEIQSRSTRKYHGNVKDFAGELKQKDFPAANEQSAPSKNNEQVTNNNNKRLFVLQSHGLAERLSEILRDYDVVIPDNSLLVGDLSGGFEIPALDFRVHTETDIFGESTQAEFQKTKPQKTKKSNIGAFISDFRDLKAGDFVVHVDHGIGHFEALQTISAQGAQREFMLLHYADNAKLFVPVERLDLVSRFSSGEAAQADFRRLGGLGWQKTKAKAKRAMRDMADELLRLYAERKLVQGFAFSATRRGRKNLKTLFLIN